MKIGLGADHGGYKLKQLIKEHLEKNGYEVVDYGTNSSDSVDYPDYGKKVAQSVIDNEVEKGIVCCGTGIGISLAANKVKGIRCANVSDTFSAKMSRAHNNCQMIALGERVLGAGLALEIVDAFLNTEFEGDRHQRRVDKIMDIEGGFTCQN
ncbi:ribose 5-phosphate isomerase B/allose 6-phosphate isomerase [Acetoanaerobium sticklandii]|uniref:Ribose 5-phosphate isomerase B/allose 6-phosphate isomerase n=1 Tax=Acetoanaerobium sticklandii (strain ATCC 12662 / DSM 519 / JCM 1433 / CCUG 9281 / NCIMB 10654 / HF) TaxID=499177 RepID=E3PTP5_ACESD|nr:ribose 5-phosphate isomerase B [Acetoanaerobium sticklandii]CBH22249.1 ribose 5-phosphate isomerase B/allose 6-phosphate isomerase [Acetoanaerobium sticklandii]